MDSTSPSVLDDQSSELQALLFMSTVDWKKIAKTWVQDQIAKTFFPHTLTVDSSIVLAPGMPKQLHIHVVDRSTLEIWGKARHGYPDGDLGIAVSLAEPLQTQGYQFNVVNGFAVALLHAGPHSFYQMLWAPGMSLVFKKTDGRPWVREAETSALYPPIYLAVALWTGLTILKRFFSGGRH